MTERIGLPDIMALDPTPFKICPLGYVKKCNAYKFAPCGPECPISPSEGK